MFDWFWIIWALIVGLSEGWQIFIAGIGITVFVWVMSLFNWVKNLFKKKIPLPPEPPEITQNPVQVNVVVEHPAPTKIIPELPAPGEQTAEIKVDISRLPVTNATLFGRDEELAMLQRAWAGEDTNIVTLIAMGGTGKTSLINTWLGQLGNDYGGATRVFVWSFYNQGSIGDTQASADAFFEAALAWFGYQGKPLKSSHDKGAMLADLVIRQRTLLVLDGLEPLQHAPGAMHGALKDQGLTVLISRLAMQNPGLLLISSRVPVHEISNRSKPLIIAHDVDQLSPEDGEKLLRHLKVKGWSKKLQDAVEEFGGHALALRLLGEWLVLAGGDIAKRDTLPPLIEHPDKGGHAKRMMAAYEKQLAGTPALAGLYIIGLFDRPATMDAVEAVLVAPVIDGLTDFVPGQKPGEWSSALQHLRKLGLLSGDDEVRDAHPLVREYFGARLKELNPKAYKQAHFRLFEYYRTLPEEEQPDTLEAMEPLFAAIAHGCATGKHQQAMDEVYHSRIQRGGETNFVCKKLGAYGADLAALAHFFDITWTVPATGLSEPAKSHVLSTAGYDLRALGRLSEAAEPMLAGLEMFKAQENWINASAQAVNLSEHYLLTGDVKNAVQMAQQAVGFVDDSEDGFQQFSKRTTHADALHMAGSTADALALFEEVEKMQLEHQPKFPFLYSLRGYQYCELLLSLGNYAVVEERARQTLIWVTAQGWLLDISLDRLSLGRASLQRAIEDDAADFNSTATLLNNAVSGLREAGSQHHIPRGLLARAECLRHLRRFDEAEKDIAEIFEISGPSGMRLFLTDAHLEAVRLARAAGRLICGKDADHHLAAAKKLIKETGYNRRLPELKELQKG